MPKKRRGRAKQCPCGKTGYRTFEIARKAGRHAPIPPRIYWCDEGGCYHSTSRDKSEYDQVVAEYGKGSWRKPRSQKPKSS